MDLFFPKRCVVCRRLGTYICQEDKAKIRVRRGFCPVCQKTSIGGTSHAKCKKTLSLDGLICLFEYQTPIKEFLHELKYKLVRDLAEEFLKEIKKAPSLREIDFTGYRLIPVPLTSTKKRTRGFNQTEVLGKKIARYLRIAYTEASLVKKQDTKPQTGLSREERRKQMKGVFKSKNNIVGQKVLLFDDVWTTGSTMKAAAAALKRRGASKVWGLVIASSHRA